MPRETRPVRIDAVTLDDLEEFVDGRRYRSVAHLIDIILSEWVDENTEEGDDEEGGS